MPVGGLAVHRALLLRSEETSDNLPNKPQSPPGRWLETGMGRHANTGCGAGWMLTGQGTQKWVT